ncbi:MAG TPA: Crp/Fnr family transcriptional regulator [Candidatus Saccharimonadales bacterium]|nr:Crp/Fnr family transcriptional regulator [Candidatus Saccharimonadales bacterium]
MLNHLRPLIKNSVRRKYSPGSTIFYQGEVPRSACIITKGIIRVYSISPQGDEQIVTYHEAGEFVPSSWIFGKTAGSLFFYETVDKCEVAFVPRDKFLDFFREKPERQYALLDYFTTAYTASLVRISALEQAKAREKLLYTLYYLCQRHGVKSKSSLTVRIKLSLTHQALASLIGLTRETTATEMNKLKNEKILRYKNQQYFINRTRLLELMGEESFKDIGNLG